MLDLLIAGAMVVDGSGGPASRQDVGIRTGRIVQTGAVNESAKATINAEGLVLAPGFIDPHTHYDAQLFWDPSADPSSHHGVTTIVGGNCGFGLAPLRSEDHGYTRNMMAVVEGMSVDALDQGVPWSWSTFEEYLASLEGRLAVNAGFMVGHCALRRFVMGPAAVERQATATQVEEMEAILHQSLASGGLGLSTTLAPTHQDAAQRPVASRHAAPDEILALCRAVGEHDGTSLEGAFAGSLGRFEDDERDLMIAMSCAAGRSINWNLLTVDGSDPAPVEHQLAAAKSALANGGDIVALTLPVVVPMNVGFASRSSLNNLPGWAETLDLPIPERIERLQRPEVRAAMEAGARHTERDLRRRHLVQFENYVVGDTWSTLNDGCAGRTIGDIARQRNARPFDVLLDIACADALRTVLWPVRQEDDDDTWSLRAKVWNDPRVVLGGSDAGAHLDRQCGASYTTRFLADVLRGRRLLSLERAVQLITDVPARLFGLRGRGRIERGRRADLVLFDPAEIDAGRPSLAQDFPGGSPRMTAGAAGISRVFVAGVETVRDGRSTGATPGSILRSGRDTATVLMRQPPATGSVTR